MSETWALHYISDFFNVVLTTTEILIYNNSKQRRQLWKRKRMNFTEDGVDGVHGDLVLGSITDQSLSVGEGDVRGRCAVALVVGDDLDAVVLPHADAGVGGAEVDSDGRSFTLSGHYSM